MDSIMDEIGNKEEWTDQFMAQVKYHLDSIRLKYNYFNNRVVAARRAMTYLYGELADCNQLYAGVDPKMVLSHDFAIEFFNVRPKPDFVASMRQSDISFLRMDWIDKPQDCVRFQQSENIVLNEMVVVAEYTVLRAIIWELPTERYREQISLCPSIDLEQNHLFFGSVFNELSADYYDLGHVGQDIIIIRDHPFDRSSLKANWIAINPDLARFLGWVPASETLFGWKDIDGDLMAESIYWANGNVEMAPYHDCETGEGWFVTLSPKALQMILTSMPALFVHKSVSRAKHKDSGEVKYEASNIYPFTFNDSIV